MTMNTNIRLALVSLFVVAAPAANAADFEDLATVLSVTERLDRYNQPRQECNADPVAAAPTAAPADRGIGGSVIGGVSGAILGAQVGKGNGKVAAAAIGAVTGALVGDRIQNNGTNSQAAQPVQRCRYVDNFVTRVSGYTVTYQYRGNTYTDNVGFNPGPTMRVRVNLTPRG
jgi:uncharacterized protein YcfJ